MKPFYVTTSIPYVNADPHIGFALELLYGDVLARKAVQDGMQVIYSTGTDEHGGKIAEKAEEKGIEMCIRDRYMIRAVPKITTRPLLN